MSCSFKYVEKEKENRRTTRRQRKYKIKEMRKAIGWDMVGKSKEARDLSLISPLSLNHIKCVIHQKRAYEEVYLLIPIL